MLFVAGFSSSLVLPSSVSSRLHCPHRLLVLLALFASEFWPGVLVVLKTFSPFSYWVRFPAAYTGRREGIKRLLSAGRASIIL